MIAYLNGNIAEIGENTVVMEVNGIGYEIFCLTYQFQDEMVSSDAVKIYIYEHIKEDGHDLYGFKTKEEKELFKKLISVSGIGPKGGMQILNTYTEQDIINIILTGDGKALSKVNGIGIKTAQRIILELKDSLEKTYHSSHLMNDLNTISSKMGEKDEAVEALAALGYTFADARKAVNTIFDERDSSEQLIKKALNLLGL